MMEEESKELVNRYELEDVLKDLTEKNGELQLRLKDSICDVEVNVFSIKIDIEVMEQLVKQCENKYWLIDNRFNQALFRSIPCSSGRKDVNRKSVSTEEDSTVLREMFLVFQERLNELERKVQLVTSNYFLTKPIVEAFIKEVKLYSKVNLTEAHLLGDQVDKVKLKLSNWAEMDAMSVEHKHENERNQSLRLVTMQHIENIKAHVMITRAEVESIGIHIGEAKKKIRDLETLIQEIRTRSFVYDTDFREDPLMLKKHITTVQEKIEGLKLKFETLNHCTLALRNMLQENIEKVMSHVDFMEKRNDTFELRLQSFEKKGWYSTSSNNEVGKMLL